MAPKGPRHVQWDDASRFWGFYLHGSCRDVDWDLLESAIWNVPAVSWNACKAPQGRQLGIFSELTSYLSHDDRRNAVIGLQEVQRWSTHRQEFRSHILLTGPKSDCGIIVPASTNSFISFTYFGDRFCMVQIKCLLFISAHLVGWNGKDPEARESIHQIIDISLSRKRIWETSSKSKLEIILFIDANVTLPENRWAEGELGEPGEQAWAITGATVLDPKQNHKASSREAVLALFETLGLSAVNTFASIDNPAKKKELATWIRRRKRKKDKVTDKYEDDGISPTPKSKGKKKFMKAKAKTKTKASHDNEENKKIKDCFS